MTGRPTNWAGNITFSARRFHRPSALEQLQHLVSESDRVRALGTGHSFNRIADTSGDLVSLADLPQIIEIDADRANVTVGGGVRYGELAEYLQRAGYAVHNLGSLPHISVAGACATGTHGSGDGNGNLATAVSAMEMVSADGELVTLGRDTDADHFRGSVVGLGALGIVTSLTLDIVPAFEIRQWVYDDLPLEQVAAHFAEIFASGYSVSLFTDWQAPRINQAWLKRRASDDAWVPPQRWMGATLADSPRHPVPGMTGGNSTAQLGVPGPWSQRLPHFRLEFTPSSGEELQSEYLLPRQYAIDALQALAGLGDRVAPVLQICEIRTVASDDLWLSPSYQQDTVAFHFTWISDTEAVTPVLAAIEAQLEPFGARPHWGKLFSTSPDVVAGLYERLPDFRGLRAHHDPTGKFSNELLDRYFPPDQNPTAHRSWPSSATAATC
jgi:alditol oxidase